MPYQLKSDIEYFHEQLEIHFYDLDTAKEATRLSATRESIQRYIEDLQNEPEAMNERSFAEQLLHNVVLMLLDRTSTISHNKPMGKVDAESVFVATREEFVHLYDQILADLRQQRSLDSESATRANIMHELLVMICRALNQVREHTSPTTFNGLKPLGI